MRHTPLLPSGEPERTPGFLKRLQTRLERIATDPESDPAVQRLGTVVENTAKATSNVLGAGLGRVNDYLETRTARTRTGSDRSGGQGPTR